MSICYKLKCWIFLGLLLASVENPCLLGQDSPSTIARAAQITPRDQASSDRNAEDGAAGQALSLLFDSRRAPQAKSMGLLQGNFLDAIEVNGSLQLAIVIDSSESMTVQLDSIRKNLPLLLDDLNRVLDGSVETAVISYSDVGQKTVPVTIHSPQFQDAETTQLVIDQLTATSGEPYFPEAVDLGIQRAIGNLPWSTDANVERWILLIGDAPPYQSSFDEPQTGAKRWYETERLVDLANQKNIHVHCLLCESRDVEHESFEKLLDDTRSFMAKLSSDTGGLMLDMSYVQVRESLASSAGRLRSQYVRVGHITQSDIQNARGSDGAAANADQPMRIIVTPFLPWEEMTLFHQRSEVQIATEISGLLKQLPNTRVVQPRQLDQQIERLKLEEIPYADWPQALCFRLNAQAIITGRLKNANADLTAEVEIYEPNSQQPSARTILTAPAEQLARQIIGQLAQTRNPPPTIAPFIARLQHFANDKNIDGTQIGALSKLPLAERERLLSAMSALEQATGYRLGDPSGVSLLKSAEENLNLFLNDKPQYPYALMLLASAQFNLAAALEVSGQVAESREKFDDSKQAIQQAFQVRNQLVDEMMKLELDGDYHLLVRQEFETSFERYQTIVAQSSKSPLNSALHAHWMLAGILRGDWGASEQDPKIVDLTAAREHLIQILAYWPESPQSELIRENLMWDPQDQKTRTPFLAQMGYPFMAQK